MQAGQSNGWLETTAGTSEAVHVAVVTSGGAILFLAAETNAEAMMEPLVGFVERSASAMLWPRDATEVHSLLASGRSEAAIDLYFAKVGDRWGCQQLHREVVELE